MNISHMYVCAADMVQGEFQRNTRKNDDAPFMVNLVNVQHKCKQEVTTIADNDIHCINRIKCELNNLLQ